MPPFSSMTDIMYLAVSGFFNSLFLIPIPWKSFFHSGGMFLISKVPSLGFQPMLDTWRKFDGSEMMSSSSLLSPPNKLLRKPFFFLPLTVPFLEAVEEEEEVVVAVVVTGVETGAGAAAGCAAGG